MTHLSSFQELKRFFLTSGKLLFFTSLSSYLVLFLINSRTENLIATFLDFPWILGITVSSGIVWLLAAD